MILSILWDSAIQCRSVTDKELQIGTSQIYSKTFMLKTRASENMPDKLLSYRLSNIGYIYCNGEQEDSNRKPD
jgi:hypothetical protein